MKILKMLVLASLVIGTDLAVGNSANAEPIQTSKIGTATVRSRHMAGPSISLRGLTIRAPKGKYRVPNLNSNF